MDGGLKCGGAARRGVHWLRPGSAGPPVRKHQTQKVKVQLVLVPPFDGAGAATAVFHSHDREVNMRNLRHSSSKVEGSRSDSTGRDGVCTPSWARSQPDRLLGAQRVSEFGGLMFACRCQE